MKTDTYTKIILTVIATCLSVIVLKDFDIITTAYAETPKHKNEMNRNYVSIPVNDDGSINVRMNYDQIVDVRIRGIDEAPSLRWEAINVKVAR